MVTYAVVTLAHKRKQPARAEEEESGDKERKKKVIIPKNKTLTDEEAESCAEEGSTDVVRKSVDERGGKMKVPKKTEFLDEDSESEDRIFFEMYQTYKRS